MENRPQMLFLTAKTLEKNPFSLGNSRLRYHTNTLRCSVTIISFMKIYFSGRKLGLFARVILTCSLNFENFSVAFHQNYFSQNTSVRLTPLRMHQSTHHMKKSVRQGAARFIVL